VLGVFGGDDVVGYDKHFLPEFEQARSDGFNKSGLPGTYGTAYSYSTGL